MFNQYCVADPNFEEKRLDLDMDQFLIFMLTIRMTLYALLRKKNSMIMPSSSAVGSGSDMFLIANPYTGILIHGDSNLSKPKKIWIILKAWNKCHAFRDSFSLLFAMKHPKTFFCLLFRYFLLWNTLKTRYYFVYSLSFFVYFFGTFCCETPKKQYKCFSHFSLWAESSNSRGNYATW